MASSLNSHKYLKVREFAKLRGLTKAFVYREIKAGRLPVVSFRGTEIKPLLINVEEVDALFASTTSNVVPITSARSLKTESVKKPPLPFLTERDLWE